MSRGRQDNAARPYRMHRRAEQIDDTRRRIVEATVALHGSVGPAATTVLAIGELAGVTRATVYRHFPDESALFAACSTHWLAGQQPPDPDRWVHLQDPLARLRAGLADLYRFYREGESMLARIYHDLAELPPEHRQALQARNAGLTELLAAPFTAGHRSRGTLRATVAHAVSFWTWRSLCVEQGLSDEVAVELMVSLAQAARRRDR